MAEKAITRRLKIFVNGQEVDATITNLRKNLAKFRSLANKSIEGTDEFKKYNAEVAKLETELGQARGAQKAFREDTKLTQKGIGDSEKALAKFTGSFSTLINGYKNGDILQVKEGFTGVKEGIKGATKAALAFIATPLGAAIAALVGIGAAAKAWFDYNSQVVEALRLTTQITGLTDAAADNARIRAQALSDAFDTDFKENLLTANALAQQFGISFDEAFDVIENQLVRGQKNNSEFFESLNEYPTFFKQAGFSAEEFGRIIATGYDLGIYKDKLPDALKEFDLAIKEQTASTRDALVNAFGAPFADEILQKVKTGQITSKEALEQIAVQAKETNIDIQANAQLTADLFKGAGEDAGGALKIFDAYNTAIVENQRALTESEQITQDQININKELDAVLSSIFSTGDQGFGLLIDKAKLFATKTLVDLLKVGIDVYNYFVDLNNESRVFAALLTSFGVAASAPFDFIGILINNAKLAFASLGDVVEGIFTFDFDKVKEGLGKGLVASVNTLKDIKAEAIKDAEDIQKAFSGGSKLERKSLSDFVAPDKEIPGPKEGDQKIIDGVPSVFKNGEWVPIKVTNTGTKKDELTAEDKRILNSKKKVAEFLKQFDEEQKILKQIKDLEEGEAAKLKQELELEAKYAQLIANAEGETELITQLKEAQRIELAQIDEEYNDAEAEKNKELNEKLLKQEKEANAKRIAERKRLGQDIINGAINLAGQETRVGQALLAAKGLMAAREMLIELGVLKGKAAVAVAEGTLATSVGAANTAKVGFPQNVPLLLAFAAQAVGIIGAIKGATKSAKQNAQIPSFARGGDTGFGDLGLGKNMGGNIRGVVEEGEYVIPRYVRQMPEVPQVIQYLEAKRTGKTRSFAEGGDVGTSNTNTNDAMVITMMQKFMKKLDEPLRILFTLNDEIERQSLQKKLDDTIKESKGK